MPLYCPRCHKRVANKAAQARHCALAVSQGAQSGLVRGKRQGPSARVIDAQVVSSSLTKVPQAPIVRVTPEELERQKRRMRLIMFWPLHKVLFPSLFGRGKPQSKSSSPGGNSLNEVIRRMEILEWRRG